MEENKKLLDYFDGDELAANVWESKYKYGDEETPDDMHRRLAGAFGSELHNINRRISEKFESVKHLLSPQGRKNEFPTGKTMYTYFKDFKHLIPQGSVMFGAGTNMPVSLSNCFVVGNKDDSYGGIFKTDEEQVQLMKRRAGVGHDISHLRPSGAYVDNSAKSSSGAVSFMNRFSESCREVSQNGRRGALMLSMHVNHPDIMEFIKIKRDLSKITGANISIKISNEFMEAVENDEDYLLQYPIHHKFNEIIDVNELEYDKVIEVNYGPGDSRDFIGYARKINARKYWDEIIKSAKDSAEPGLMFEDMHINGSPDGVYEQYRGITTNPCGEIFMEPYNSCRLMAINFLGFVENPYRENSYFNYSKLYEVSYNSLIAGDALVDMEIMHIDRILKKINKDLSEGHNSTTEKELWEKIKKVALNSRRIGMGFTALGDTLAALGIKYDEGHVALNSILNTMHEAFLDASIDLAILLGTFEGFNAELERDTNNIYYENVKKFFPKQWDRMQRHGRRNVSFSTIAPTGSVSILARTTSGIEPLFQPYYFRRKKVNPNDVDVKVDFVDNVGDSWQMFAVIHPEFEKWIRIAVPRYENADITKLESKEFDRLFEMSPWHESTANDIDWIKRVEIQSVAQKYITHSISSTINLPSTVTYEEVSNIYLEGWRKKLKGLTVYVEGSRSGVLVNNPSIKEESDFTPVEAIKRPKTLDCDIHKSTTAGKNWLVIVGLMNNRPYEVFCTEDDGSFKSNKGAGTLTKQSRGRYLLESGDVSIEAVNSNMTDEQVTITRLISTSLRHRTDNKFIVEQLRKSEGSLSSFNRSIARVLQKYIKDGEESTVSCDECGSNSVIFEDGCNRCLDCGSSACS